MLAGFALALLPCLGTAQPAARIEFAPLSQKFAEILGAHRRNLEDLRAQMVSKQMISSGVGEVAFAQSVLDHHLVSPKSVSDGEAIGVLIGDQIVRRGDFQWLDVTDQWGTEPVVCHKQKQVFAAPISGVLKRFRRGEADFNVAELVEGLTKTCLEQISQASDLPPKLRR